MHNKVEIDHKRERGKAILHEKLHCCCQRLYISKFIFIGGFYLNNLNVDIENVDDW